MEQNKKDESTGHHTGEYAHHTHHTHGTHHSHSSHSSHHSSHHHSGSSRHGKKKDDPNKAVLRNIFKNFKRIVFCVLVIGCIVGLIWMLTLPDDQLNETLENLRQLF